MMENGGLVVLINFLVVVAGFGATYGRIRSEIRSLSNRVGRIEKWLDRLLPGGGD